MCKKTQNRAFLRYKHETWYMCSLHHSGHFEDWSQTGKRQGAPLAVNSKMAAKTRMKYARYHEAEIQKNTLFHIYGGSRESVSGCGRHLEKWRTSSVYGEKCKFKLNLDP